MALYIPSLEKVQLGLEVAFNDAAMPTVQLIGISDCKITPKVEASQILDKRGTTMPAYIASVNRVSAEAEISGVVNYAQMLHWLKGIFDTGASPWLAELDAAAAPQTFNLVYGQPDVTYGMPGGVMDRLTIRGATNGPLTFSAHLNGVVVVPDTLEALEDPTVVIAMGHHIALWIDPLAGPIGTTLIATTELSFETVISLDRTLVWHLGSLYPDNYRAGKWGGSLRLVLEMTSDMQDILDAVLGQEISPGGYTIRLRATDDAATSILTLDMAGHILAAPMLYTDAEGITTCELAFAPVMSTDATFESCWGAALTLPA